MSFVAYSEERPCPTCGRLLHWEILRPPIPMTFYQWVDETKDADMPGYVTDECPSCGTVLPDGDLRAKETA